MSTIRKKIAVLTFIDTPNYGALLQAYALQQYLNNIGNDCFVIDYQNKKRQYSQVNGFRRIRSFVWQKTLAKFFTNETRNKRTKWFKNNLINKSRRTFTNNESLSSLNNTVDVFIVGSDQVWNPKNNAKDPAFLLSFVDSKKTIISYAASFGTDEIDESYLHSNDFLFKRFNKISVREQSGKDLLERVLHIKADIVADPVFLLSKASWCDLVKNNCSIEHDHDYVLCYVLPGNKQVEESIYKIANKISQKIGIQIITIGKKHNSEVYKGEYVVSDCGPLEFLEYLIGAKYIITNSFHGTAFSVLCEKNFWTIMGTGTSAQRNTRLTNLLAKVGLDDRGIICSEREKEDYMSVIEYSKVNKRVEAMINDAKSFLKDALN